MKTMIAYCNRIWNKSQKEKRVVIWQKVLCTHKHTNTCTLTLAFIRTRTYTQNAHTARAYTQTKDTYLLLYMQLTDTSSCLARLCSATNANTQKARVKNAPIKKRTASSNIIVYSRGGRLGVHKLQTILPPDSTIQMHITWMGIDEKEGEWTTVVGCSISMLIHSQHHTHVHARKLAHAHTQVYVLTAIQPIQLELHRYTIEKMFRM